MSVTFGSPEEETLQALTKSLELEDSHTQKVREAILALARSQRGAHDLGVGDEVWMKHENENIWQAGVIDSIEVDYDATGHRGLMPPKKYGVVNVARTHMGWYRPAQGELKLKARFLDGASRTNTEPTGADPELVEIAENVKMVNLFFCLGSRAQSGEI